MLVLLGVGFLAGLVTSLSPCVLPVLPILLAGGASGGGRRPYAIVAGLVVSFVVFTLAAAALLDALGLPEDFLRDLAIVLLFVVAATLFWPRLGALLERPFYFLTRRRTNSELGGGFVLGASLGLVFVPCAGPVLAAVSVLAANEEIGLEVVLLTLAYALGAAIPMLAIALGGRRVSVQLRSRMRVLRPALGAVIALTAVGIALGFDRPFQTAVPGYTAAFQERVEDSAFTRRELADLTGGEGAEAGRLADFGPAPELDGIVGWINSDPRTLASLRGRVVVVDFWTYSCINCLRTLPYLKAWDAAYRDDGLTILGVHSPEFAFERKAGNVRSAVRDLGIRYPVALDNEFETWNAYANRYWPAKYFVDRRGHLRFAHFGEGAYDESERVIRRLLAEGGEAGVDGRASVSGADEASSGQITPESYLGWERLDRYAGSPVRAGVPAAYSFPRSPLALHQLAFDGRWRLEAERAVAGVGARLRLRFRARDVHLVLSGRGTVQVLVDGRPEGSVRVQGDRLYTLLRGSSTREGLLELRFAPGVAGYAFTFG
jgi:cytochrome c biogenesis protein CcdA/thiol-disulfide isomerase/thioredoxin